MSRLVLYTDEKTGEPVRKDLLGEEEIRKRGYISIPALEGGRDKNEKDNSEKEM